MLEILNLPPDERDAEIRKLIVPKPWKHKCKWVGRMYQPQWWCTKCDKRWEKSGYGNCIRNLDHPGKYYDPCPAPDPIALDWNLAMQMRDEAVNEDLMAWIEAKKKTYDAVYAGRGWTLSKESRRMASTNTFFSNNALPYHYILAAWEAKEGLTNDK